MADNLKIKPVLIGADMNCYNMARAFHEEYGLVSNAFGRWQMGDTMYSRIVNFTMVPDIDNEEVLLKTISDFANANSDYKCIVLGCTDDYASLLMDIKGNLPQNCIAPYISPALRDKLVSKADFYRLCDEHDILYPKTYVLKSPEPLQNLSEENLGFNYPIVIKPSSSIRYWKFPFDGMKKVYFAEDANEAKQICEQIYSAGYDDELILQDNIPGDDSLMRVLTAYCDKKGKVKMMCLGHVGLEEHTPKALGNHAAIITEYNEELMLKIKGFLEEINYTGFANFDIKYDRRDNTYRVFEINLRQGRSNFYVTGAGLNLAKYIVSDHVDNIDLGEPLLFKGEHFWHSVPKGVVFKYVQDEKFIEKAKELCAMKKESCTFNYAYDLKMNLKRFAYYIIHQHRYYKKFEDNKIY